MLINYFKKILKHVYRLSLKPFFKKGINIKIGSAGNFYLDYIFAFNKFGNFGREHNAGFTRWLNICRGKNLIFDIGAHIGLYSITASPIMGRNGYIYAFEPSSANRHYLEKHIRFNNADNIKVFSYLMGDKSLDETAFYENRDVDGMDSIAIWKNFNSYNRVFRRQISLDNFCEPQNIIPEVIKIDVEGAELNVLKGGEKIIRRYKPIIFLSAHPKRLRLLNQSAYELKNFIDNLNYDIYNAAGEEKRELEFDEYILTPAKERSFHEIFEESV